MLEMALELAIFKQKVPSHIFRHQPIKFHYLQVYTLSTTFFSKKLKNNLL